MLHKVYGQFHYDPETGLYLIIPDRVMPVRVERRKLLEPGKVPHYCQEPYYGEMAETKSDAKDTLLAWIASEGLGTHDPRPWASALVDFFIDSSGMVHSQIRSFAAHETVALAAYYNSLGVSAASARENWELAEAALLEERLRLESGWV